ncbi:toll/interleukin-1 receptor domain-containing protein [Oceanidesulfovibrio marinus]|uniref:TIR domain-containing protein n=1 Tax=Oceanidesulfovibrio marinus TaxID=370038 RepID=A0A6P1ZEX3_9BACT|nr:toll/interleukin-1 receptor domain-containing protein [Oceanidesulfovibrio marinus]TVM31829.1 hypothetical protein DQK91_16585 [Oceanidesulfovibrio marinus]
MRKVFISQCTKDKEIANSFFRLLCTGVGIPADDILNTSLEGAGVPPGEDFIQFIQNNLQGSKCLIPLISQNYYHSTFCVSELGGAWATCKKVFPLIIPPMDYNSVDAIWRNTQSALITDEGKLSEFAQSLADFLNIKLNAPRWETMRKTFLGEANNFISNQKEPPIVIYDEYKKLSDELSLLKNDYRRILEENAGLKQSYEQLKEIKDASEVKSFINNNTPHIERFEELAREVHDMLSQYGYLVKQYIFYEATNRDTRELNKLSKDYDDEFRVAEERNLIQDSGGGYGVINRYKNKISELLNSISDVREVIEDSEEDFINYYYSKYKSDLDISDREFWEEHFDL